MFFFLACEVVFDNTKVPVENVIGEVGGGFKVIRNAWALNMAGNLPLLDFSKKAICRRESLSLEDSYF